MSCCPIACAAASRSLRSASISGLIELSDIAAIIDVRACATAAAKAPSAICFSSSILPPYARRSKSLEVFIPMLYLTGVSTGDFEEALPALLGKDAGGLSASTIGRLKEVWSEELTRWSKRDLSAKRYVYFWVDGIHVQARLEDAGPVPAGDHRRHA
jgi:hypothetical protein